MLKKFKDLPKVYWIYVAVIIVAETIAFSLRPDTPGLYTHGAQYLPLLTALPFLFFKKIRKNFKPALYAFAILPVFGP